MRIRLRQDLSCRALFLGLQKPPLARSANAVLTHPIDINRLRTPPSLSAVGSEEFEAAQAAPIARFISPTITIRMPPPTPPEAI